jgi:hypothetical protein
MMPDAEYSATKEEFATKRIPGMVATLLRRHSTTAASAAFLPAVEEGVRCGQNGPSGPQQRAKLVGPGTPRPPRQNGTPATDTVGFRLFLRPLMPDRSHSAVGPSKQWFQTEINGSYKNWLSMVHTWTSMPHYAKMVRPLARGHIASTVREGRGQGVGGQEPE